MVSCFLGMMKMQVTMVVACATECNGSRMVSYGKSKGVVLKRWRGFLWNHPVTTTCVGGLGLIGE